MNRREGVLNKAKEYVLRDRNALHGDPEDNFKVIANLYNAYVDGRKRELERNSIVLMSQDFEFLPHDVAVLNILQKVARIITSPSHMDHWVDIAGYAACGADCVPMQGVEERQAAKEERLAQGYYGTAKVPSLSDLEEIKEIKRVKNLLKKPRKKYTRKRRKSK